MTDEQTKQNAEEYAKKIYPYTVGKAAAIRDFIAGAHSRDEEVKELDQLRNPWISVEERLPEKTRNLSPFPDEYDEKVVLVINKHWQYC